MYSRNLNLSDIRVGDVLRQVLDNKGFKRYEYIVSNVPLEKEDEYDESEINTFKIYNLKVHKDDDFIYAGRNILRSFVNGHHPENGEFLKSVFSSVNLFLNCHSSEDLYSLVVEMGI